MSNSNNYYITTAISYPNGAPHIGHAYELIATDAIARFKRLDGYDVLFLTGVDEHGQKMVKTANEQGVSVSDLADKNAARFKLMAQELNASNDDFIRTSEQRHHEASQEIWKRMEANGDIYKSKYEGWYSIRDEAYYAEDEITTTDEGIKNGPQGTVVEWVEEESYFFKLSSYQEKLLKYFEENPSFIGPKERANEVISFVKSGLRDLSISRTTFDWGVKVPGDDKHVMYVWVDALTNYLTATGFPEVDTEKSNFWPADLHIIGKDILRFHAIYWPAFLMSANLPLPKRIYAHGFLFNSGEKMSKSLGNVIDPFELAEKFGLDALRFFLLREVPFGKDGSYSENAIISRMNADLSNDLGNLAQRSLSMVFKNLDGVLSKPAKLLETDQQILDATSNLLDKCRQYIDEQAIHKAIGEIWKVIGDANKYFAAQEPWALKKTDPKRMADVLYVTAEIIRKVAILASPIIPSSSDRLLNLLSVEADKRSFEYLEIGHEIENGTTIGKPQAVFPRFHDKASD